jgi:parallel beta-helix repeat protein
LIKNNFIFDTTDFGIRLVKSNFNKIEYNTLTDNPIGIGFMSGGDWEYDIDPDSNFNIIKRNEISGSNICGIRIKKSSYNLIYCNVFKKNRINAFFIDCKNIWLRNYWDRPRLLPKPILGAKFNIIPWFNFDWLPAKLPYNI